jgi:hypothetical protein
MSIELKIKSKHLSEEAKIIRFEERKLLKGIDYRRTKHKASGNNTEYKVWADKNWRDYYSLSTHRKRDVRNENRATYLARAYIAGVSYNTVEQKRKFDNEHTFANIILPRVFAMVVKYGKREDGDWEWDKVKQRYAATKQLKDKIVAWCELKQ